MEKTKKEKKTKVKKENNKQTNARKRNLKIKPINLIITLLVSLVLIGLCYYFLGSMLTIIITIGIILILLIGHWLDKPKPKTKRRKVLKVIFTILLAFGIIGLLGASAFMVYIVKNAPDFKQEQLKKQEATILYDSDGNELTKLGAEFRENIEYDEVSEIFIDALIATEDSRFFQHNGFDLMRFAKATAGQLMGNSNAGGGSTLTMQVSKNTFTSTEAKGIEGIIRKFTDIYISIFQLERNYTKEQIIEFYINNNALGAGGKIYGVQEASQYFFGKDAKDLNLSEAALLAGMYQAPTSYDPIKNPKNATKRRSTVLYLMQRHGYITKEERELAESIPVESLLSNDSKSTNPYQSYIDLVVDEVKERWGVDPNTTPMLIYTNMVRSKQNGVNDIMSGKTFKWKDDLIQAGIAVVDSTSGKIMAIGGGRNRKPGDWNYATDTNRQIGSTAKPLFDYAPGMEYNNWSTYTLFDDSPYTYSNGKSINNYDNQFEGTITLRRALSNSRNIPALKAFQQVDNKKITELVTSVGITPEISNGYIHEAHAIGAFTGSNPLTMAGAYQIFSNGGYYYEPYAVSKVTFRTNGESYEYSSPKVKVISDSTAYMITDVLKGAIKQGVTNKGLNKDHFAIKTGTTNVDSATKKAKKLPSSIVRDYWIEGYTHNTVISIWIGYDELSSKNYLDYNKDYNMRHYLLNAVGKVCFSHDNTNFTKPKSVVSVNVEKNSDPPMLPSANTPEDQIEKSHLFKRGTEPTEVSTKYLTLETPSNFSVKYNNNSVTLSWSPVTDLKYVEGGQLGYYIYFGNPEEPIDFTTNTSYTINNFDSYIGTYYVKAGYKDTTNSMSTSANFELKETVSYNLTITGKSSTTYNVNEAINPALYNGSIVSLTANGTNITSSSNINIIIKDKDGNVVTNLDNSKANTYTISYYVSYGTYSGSCTNTIIIVDNTPTTPPTETPPETPTNPENNNSTNNNSDGTQ